MGTLARSCVLLALLASPVADADAPHDGDGAYQRSFSVASTALRNHLLNAGDFGYDKTTPPESNREPHSYSQAGTTVAVQVRFFKIDAVDPRTGSMQAKAWLRMEWEDLRLAWEPAAWGNLSYVYFNHPFHEEPEIWVPDIVPYNARAKVADSFESAVAIVSHTGRVKWSRPGMLDIMCKFRGLVRFPFDSLECGVDMGGWMISGAQQGIELLGFGYDFNSEEATAGTSYQEFAIQEVEVGLQLYEYALTPAEKWPVVHFQLKMARAWSFYVIVLLLPSLLISVAAFGVLFVSPDCGERLGYGISIILAMEVYKVFIYSLVPVCGETLWADLWNMTNSVVVYAVLLESVVVLSVSSIEFESMLPPWVMKLFCQCSPRRKAAPATSAAESFDLARCPNFSVARHLFRGVNQQVEHSERCSERSSRFAAPAKLVEPTEHAARTDSASGSASMPSPTGGDAGAGARRSALRLTKESMLEADRMLTHEDKERLVYFEWLFFAMDQSAKGFLEADAVRLFLTYTALHLSDAQINQKIADGDTSSVDGEEESDNLLVRYEFCKVCIACLWDVPFSSLERGVHAYQAAMQHQLEEQANKWKHFGRRIDQWSRAILIPVYPCALTLVFNLNLDDEQYVFEYDNASVIYRTPNRDPAYCLPPKKLDDDGRCLYEPEQFQGVSSASMRLDNVLRVLIVPLAFLALYLVACGMRWCARRKHLITDSKDIARANAEAMQSSFAPEGQPAPKKRSFSVVASSLAAFATGQQWRPSFNSPRASVASVASRSGSRCNTPRGSIDSVVAEVTNDDSSTHAPAVPAVNGASSASVSVFIPPASVATAADEDADVNANAQGTSPTRTKLEEAQF